MCPYPSTSLCSRPSLYLLSLVLLDLSKRVPVRSEAAQCRESRATLSASERRSAVGLAARERGLGGVRNVRR